VQRTRLLPTSASTAAGIRNTYGSPNISPPGGRLYAPRRASKPAIATSIQPNVRATWRIVGALLRRVASVRLDFRDKNLLIPVSAISFIVRFKSIGESL